MFLHLPVCSIGQERGLEVGVAKVDITPSYPVRLNGFGFRRTESEGVSQRVWAKALAINDPSTGPAIFLAVDNLGIPAEIHQELGRRLKGPLGLSQERLCITATHTHTAPMLRRSNPTLFSLPIPPEHLQRIDRYTDEFIDALERASLEAWKNRKPATLWHAVGRVGFAINRRTPGGPVDHDLPVLAVRDTDGAWLAVLTSYACHCVTLSHNFIGGDWAGHAQEAIEKAFPGTIALTAVGCGADSNPSSGVVGDQVAIAAQQGQEISDEVRRLLTLPMRRLTGPLAAAMLQVALPLEAVPTRSDLEKRVQRQDAVGYHARFNLEKLDRGLALPTSIPYTVQTWSFGSSLTMVNLPGEVVVDYSLRLKREFDRSRIWVNAYANEAPCYIPSERVLKEGGYEGGDAMVYYDQPSRFAPGVEAHVVNAVHKLVPTSYRAPPGTDGVIPLDSTNSLTTIQLPEGFEIQCVASEPDVISPVALDWGQDGRVWVCEMHDYPQGMDNRFQPGGRVRVFPRLSDGGRLVDPTVFLRGIPFPTGVMAWGRGVLVCAAPDILYAEDTDGDHRADKVLKIFSGFATENYQARVNGLSLGLDGWIYGANGLLGGIITNHISGGNTDIRGRDFRFRLGRHLDSALFETVSGLSQQGRVRDDWDQWFGCDNTTLLNHYPLAESYMRRNLAVSGPPSAVFSPEQPDANQLHPISRPSERFNDPDHLNRPTSVCGIGIYRDDLWGASFEGNAFVCEPVHNLVRRFELLQQGALVRARKFESEQSREFMASSDAWHRPVQARCGPDGGLWVVDMYRFLVEHPRWITPQRLASLDMRAGADMGRLFRIGRAGVPFREVRDLTRMQIGELAGSMDAPNGVERDRVQLALFHRADPACVPSLSRVANESRYPAARAQAVAALAMGGWLEWNVIEGALRDPDHRVAAMALRFCERFLQQGASVPGGVWSQLAELENNPAPVIQQQLALSLGQSPDLRAGKLLARLAQKHAADPWMRASILSSAPPHISALMESTADWVKPGADPAPPILIFMEHLLATALAHSNPHAAGVSTVNRWVESDGTLRGWRLSMVARWVETTKGMIPGSLGPRMMGVRETAADSSAAIPDRRDAVRLLGWMQEQRGLDLEVLGSLASSSEFPELRSAALERLGKIGDSTSSIMLLKDWGRKSPALRTEALQVLLTRDVWIHQVLEWIRKGDMAAQDLSPAQRTALLKQPNKGIRELAQASLPPAATDDRQQIVLRYSNLPSIQPPAAGGSNGPALFQANCASCHRFKGNGFRVGPDLDSLASRDEPFWIQQILNPNAIVEPRFVAYQVSLTDGREVSGVIESESAASLQLAQPGGSPLSILRSEISVVRPMSLSLMPEGLEESLSREAMASLLAYLRAPAAKEQPSATRQPSAPPRDPKALAAILLDARVSDAEKEGAAATHPHLAFAILQELVRELGDDSKEEYRRIPWMWRVSLMAGRRADHRQLRRMIDLATPQPNERLRDWQAVVIGGGVINGLSQAGIQPGPRIHELIAGDRALLARWEQALKLAALMAESSTVPEGTRYDAIRMMGMETWTARGDQLRKFLGLTTHPELQMGAVSALSDMPEPEAGLEIAKAFSLLTPGNLQLAIDAALQRADRTLIFLKAVDEGRLDKKHITPERLEKLRSASDPEIRTWARAVSRE